MMFNFKIKKDKHYSNNLFYRLFNVFSHFFVKDYKRVEHRIIFNKNCLYTPQNDDTNKLVGFSLGMEHDNSLRFGWRCKNTSGLIQIMCYYYIDKIMFYKPLLYVRPEKEYVYVVEYSDNRYRFIVKNSDNEFIANFETEILKREKSYYSYNLYFYFGGDLPAPHDMQIKTS